VCKTSICFLPIVFWWSEECILGHRCNLAIWISQFPFAPNCDQPCSHPVCHLHLHQVVMSFRKGLDCQMPLP
jgi:hypothetical protein